MRGADRKSVFVPTSSRVPGSKYDIPNRDTVFGGVFMRGTAAAFSCPGFCRGCCLLRRDITTAAVCVCVDTSVSRLAAAVYNDHLLSVGLLLECLSVCLSAFPRLTRGAERLCSIRDGKWDAGSKRE